MKKWVSVLITLAFVLQIFAIGYLNRREEVWVSGKRVLMVIAPENFRDEELFETREELLKAGAKVKICSTKSGRLKGMLGGTAQPDLLLKDVKIEEWDAIVFVGGIGSQIFFHDENVLSLVREAASQGKVIGAICIAPVILANAGILENKKATVWNGEFRTMLENGGAKYVKQPVVVDGKIVTANGPAAAREFGKTIAKVLARV